MIPLSIFRRARLYRLGPLLADPSSKTDERSSFQWPAGISNSTTSLLSSPLHNIRESNMRLLLVFAALAAAFAATMTVDTTDANAVVCAAGVYPAGCAGPQGAAVVVRPPVVACRYVVVNGARVRRCV
jgi:hypothetical protein